jgi:NAD(P)-dependent dehydrogenase (short-subunit alcohol dehydrogenase family)
MVSIDHFRQELLSQMGRASRLGRIDILINSAELAAPFREKTPRRTYSCDAMQAEMKSGDILILDRTNGAGMTVRYLLPRAS